MLLFPASSQATRKSLFNTIAQDIQVPQWVLRGGRGEVIVQVDCVSPGSVAQIAEEGNIVPFEDYVQVVVLFQKPVRMVVAGCELHYVFRVQRGYQTAKVLEACPLSQGRFHVFALEVGAVLNVTRYF